MGPTAGSLVRVIFRPAGPGRVSPRAGRWRFRRQSTRSVPRDARYGTREAVELLMQFVWYCDCGRRLIHKFNALSTRPILRLSTIELQFVGITLMPSRLAPSAGSRLAPSAASRLAPSAGSRRAPSVGGRRAPSAPPPHASVPQRSRGGGGSTPASRKKVCATPISILPCDTRLDTLPFARPDEPPPIAFVPQ